MNYKIVLDKIYEDIKVKYTIVIPVFNQQKIIIKNINSIISNTLGDYEIIIINDYSNDKTLELLKNFFLNFEPIYSNFKRIRIIDTYWPLFETKCDNIGFKLSKAKFVLEIQADMQMLTKGYDQILSKPFNKIENVIAVSGRCAHFFDYKNQSDGTGKLGVNIEKSIKELNVKSNNFYIFDTCNRGPLLIDNYKLRQMNYLDERNYFLDNSEHDLMMRARLSKNYICGYFPIDFYAPLKDGSTRNRKIKLNFKNIVNFIELKRLKIIYRKREFLDFRKYRKAFGRSSKEILIEE